MLLEMTRKEIWLGIVPIFRTATYGSKLPSPGQQGSVPELDGSLGFSNKTAASRFGKPKLPGGLSPSSGMRGLPALLPVICSQTHPSGTHLPLLKL